MWSALPDLPLSLVFEHLVDTFDYASAAALAATSKQAHDVWLRHGVPRVARQFAALYRGVAIREAAAALPMLEPATYVRAADSTVPRANAHAYVHLPPAPGYSNAEALQLSVDMGLVLEASELDRLESLGYAVVQRPRSGTRTRRLRSLFSPLGMSIVNWATQSDQLSVVRDGIRRAVLEGAEPVCPWGVALYSHRRHGTVRGAVLVRHQRLLDRWADLTSGPADLSATGLIACVTSATGSTVWSTGWGASASEANAFAVFWSAAHLLVGGTYGGAAPSRPALSGLVNTQPANEAAARAIGLQIPPVRAPMNMTDAGLYNQYLSYTYYLSRRTPPLPLARAAGDLQWLFHVLTASEYPGAHALFAQAMSVGRGGVWVSAQNPWSLPDIWLTRRTSTVVDVAARVTGSSRRLQKLCQLSTYQTDQLLIRWSVSTMQLSVDRPRALCFYVEDLFKSTNTLCYVSSGAVCGQCKRVLYSGESIEHGAGRVCKQARV